MLMRRVGGLVADCRTLDRDSGQTLNDKKVFSERLKGLLKKRPTQESLRARGIYKGTLCQAD